jgi:hypothetical protein
MLNENAKKWVAALRSGRFKQARGGLCIDGKYCCLGVAYRVYAEENEHVPFTEDIGYIDDPFTGTKGVCSTFSGDSETSCILLPSVRDWLGLRTTVGKFYNPGLPWFKSRNNNWSLVQENDTAKASFRQIASLIESEPEGLFKKEASC